MHELKLRIYQDVSKFILGMQNENLRQVGIVARFHVKNNSISELKFWIFYMRYQSGFFSEVFATPVRSSFWKCHSF